MFEIRRSPDARAAEQAMPESLSVAYGASLDEIADDPWLAGDVVTGVREGSLPPPPRRPAR